MPEMVRFIATGVTATIGNMTAVWVALQFVPFKIALLAGIGTGFTISFTLSKFFAFRRKMWSKAEVARFIMVYATGSLSYWVVAVIVRWIAMGYIAELKMVEMGSAFIGAGTMFLTSYFGHRFFTYRTHQSTPT